MHSKSLIILLLTVLLGLVSCQREKPKVRAMYYWSTTLRMDSAKLRFIREHGVTRLYVRYFDVVIDERDSVMPNATITFRDSFPSGMDIIPTIFIVNDCMRRPTQGLAQRILRRVMQMNKTHGIGPVREIQIDCDWTVQTERRFFAFMSELRKLAKEQGIGLSSTIRLHQLSRKVPPADRGILMMYNTGDHTDIRQERPILDLNDARPYLRHLRSYRLPLSTAYPLYAWDIVFRNGTYIGIQHFEDEIPLMPGDTIMHRQPTMDVIMQVREAVGQQNPRANDEVILFDLNQANITRFKTNDYEEIFGH